jgi:hypothetical protein
MLPAVFDYNLQQQQQQQDQEQTQQQHAEGQVATYMIVTVVDYHIEDIETLGV